MKKSIREDIPVYEDYLDDMKSELRYAQNFRKPRFSSNLIRRIRRKIYALMDNKKYDPDKYDALSKERSDTYKELRDIEYKFQELSDKVIEIETELTERWQPEDEEDIFG